MMRNDSNAVKEELFSNSLKRPGSENVDSGSEFSKNSKKIKTDPALKDDRESDSPDDPKRSDGFRAYSNEWDSRENNDVYSH